VTTEKKKILCVEDDVDSSELYTAILDGHDITAVATIKDAVSLIRRERFDMCLLDYLLVDGTGLEFCLLLKHSNPEMPVLFISGIPNLTEELAKELGADGLIRKATPDFVAHLKNEVSRLLSTTSSAGAV
jgi:two-component system OmpR family response regulator